MRRFDTKELTNYVKTRAAVGPLCKNKFQDQEGKIYLIINKTKIIDNYDKVSLLRWMYITKKKKKDGKDFRKKLNMYGEKNNI